MTPLVELPEFEGAPAILVNPSWVLWTKATLLAAKHVNEQNCVVLGPGCEQKLLVNSAGGGDGVNGTIKLEIFFVDLHGTSADNSPGAAQMCLATKAEVIVGSTTTDQSTLITSFVNGLGRVLG
jgi:hypothetical protein